MNLIEALNLCQHGGHRVRPTCWRTLNPGHWIEAVPTPHHSGPCIFAEHGTYQEIPHILRLQFPPEFLGDWETVELDERRQIRECACAQSDLDKARRLLT